MRDAVQDIHGRWLEVSDQLSRIHIPDAPVEFIFTDFHEGNVFSSVYGNSVLCPLSIESAEALRDKLTAVIDNHKKES